MAGAVAETRPAEEAAGLKGGGIHALAMTPSRDPPMRVTRCRNSALHLTLQVY